MASVYDRHVDLPTFMEGVKKRNPGQDEFVQAVGEVARDVFDHIGDKQEYSDAKKEVKEKIGRLRQTLDTREKLLLQELAETEAYEIRDLQTKVTELDQALCVATSVAGGPEGQARGGA